MKIDLKTTAPVTAVEPAIVAIKEPEPAKVVTLQKVERALSLNERIPSNWYITPEEDDKVSCVNGITGRTFNGTMAEFNAMLRG